MRQSTITPRTFVLVVLVCLAVPLVTASSQSPSGWPHFLGRGHDLTEAAEQLSASQGVPAVKLRWRRPIGPGYTQPVVMDGIAYVGFSDGDNDVMVALSLRNGAELWRYEIAPTWRGVDGSDDGPISTPALAGGKLVGLGPRGHLFAVDARTGREHWRVDLAAEHGLQAASYGVATSPLITEGLVIIQMGGSEGRSIAAFDENTGERLWSVGDDSVEYQSPVMATFGGVRQVLAVTATEVSGLDPVTGSILWHQTYNRKALNHSCPVVVMDDDRFMITTSVNSVAYAVEGDAGGLFARQLWRSRELKLSYTVPVYRSSFVYGWSGDFMVCIDAATGKRRWKSRRPGLGSLLGLGDWMVAWTVEGRLVFLRPEPEAYHEVASHQVFERGSLVHPVWTGNGILLRGKDELALLDLRVTAEAVPIQADENAQSAPAQDGLSQLLDRLAASQGADPEKERQTALEQFFATLESAPLVEANGTVHFVYRGPADDVGLVFGSAPIQTPLAMHNPQGTDLWYRTEKLNLRGAYVYRFEIDGERLVADPRNAKRAAFFMPCSLLEMPSFKPDPAFALDAKPVSIDTGKLETVQFRSELLDNERSIALYTPAGFDPEHTYPFVLVTSGMDRTFGKMTTILDRAMGRSVAKAIVVFVDVALPVAENIFYESLGNRGPLYTRMLVEELLPFLENRLPLTRRRQERLVMGTSLLAARALDVALRYPQIFGAVAVQSMGLNAAAEREFERVAKAAAAQRPRIYLEWCERDLISIGEATDIKRSSLNLRRILMDAGYEVEANELPGGFCWEMWATQTEAILERFLPMVR